MSPDIATYPLTGRFVSFCKLHYPVSCIQSLISEMGMYYLGPSRLSVSGWAAERVKRSEMAPGLERENIFASLSDLEGFLYALTLWEAWFSRYTYLQSDVWNHPLENAVSAAVATLGLSRKKPWVLNFSPSVWLNTGTGVRVAIAHRLISPQFHCIWP